MTTNEILNLFKNNITLIMGQIPENFAVEISSKNIIAII